MPLQRIKKLGKKSDPIAFRLSEEAESSLLVLEKLSGNTKTAVVENALIDLLVAEHSSDPKGVAQAIKSLPKRLKMPKLPS